MPISEDERAAVAAYCKDKGYAATTESRICSCLADKGIDMVEVLDPAVDPDTIAEKAPRGTQSYHRNMRWAVGHVRAAMSFSLLGGDRPAGV